MTLPNFIIIGAAKSGTTALYRYIKQHPQIFMSERKEPHHFSFNDDTKLTNGPGDYVRSAITNFSEYVHLFDKVGNETAIGEASPTYIYIPGTAERIYSVIPNTKIIAILRHPAERAFSAYMHLIRDGFETLSFEEALNNENKRIAENWGPIWHYTKSGFYFEQLSRYYKIFNSKSIKVILYEEFKKNPQGVLQDIFNFLGVEEHFLPDISARPNVSGVPKNKTWQNIISHFFDHDNLIRDLSRKIFSEEVRWKVTSKLRNKNLEQQKMPIHIKNQLIDIFENDIRNLQELINYDLSAWLYKND